MWLCVKGTVKISGARTDTEVRQSNERIKQVIFKNCASFNRCINKINNTQIDNAKYLEFVMLMYNLIKYSDNYAKTSWSLWKYCRYEQHDANIADSKLFRFKARITGPTLATDSIKCWNSCTTKILE